VTQCVYGFGLLYFGGEMSTSTKFRDKTEHTHEKKFINNIVYGYSENGKYFRTRVRVRVQVRATLTVTFFLTSTVWDI